MKENPVVVAKIQDIERFFKTNLVVSGTYNLTTDTSEWVAMLPDIFVQTPFNSLPANGVGSSHHHAILDLYQKIVNSDGLMRMDRRSKQRIIYRN